MGIDLEAFGTVALSGPSERIEDLLRSIALELGSDDDLADTYAVAIGVDGVAETDRMITADADVASARVRSTSESVTTLLEAAGAPTTFAYRCGPSGARLEATVVVLSSDLDDLTCLRPARPRLGVALVTTAAVPDAGATITIDDDGAARLDPLGVTFTAAGVRFESASAVEQVSSTHDDSGDPQTNGHHRHPVRVEDLALPELALPRPPGQRISRPGRALERPSRTGQDRLEPRRPNPHRTRHPA